MRKSNANSPSSGQTKLKGIDRIFQNYGLSCNVLAASIRNTVHVTQALLAGADILTMPFPVLKTMMHSPFTDIGLQRFLEDWAKISGK